MTYIRQKKCTTPKRVVIPVIAALFLLIMLYGFLIRLIVICATSNGTCNNTEQVTIESEIITIKASKLKNEYESNPLKFRNKIVRITDGYIVKIRDDKANYKPFISIEEKDNYASFSYYKCYLSTDGIEKSSNLKTGDKVNIIGSITEEGMFIVLSQCEPEYNGSSKP